MKKKHSILFLCGWYPSRVLPTNGDFIQRHAAAVSIKNDVSVLHIISDKTAKKSIEISSKNINDVETHIAYLKTTKNPILKAYRFLKAFFILIRKIPKFEVVHLNKLYPFGVFALYLKWLKKTPFIVSEHWTDYKYPLSKKISFSEKLLSKKTAKNASFICPVTKDLEKSMKLFGLKGTYYPVENVVNTAMFSPIKTKNTVFTIVHISNMLDTHKNVSGILKTIAKLSQQNIDFHLKCIGQNSKNYESLSKELGISSSNITFINQVSHNDVAFHLQNADVFVLFSNFENLPCVILEAFSCGIPVISTNVGGIHEYFPNDFGALIPVKNEKKLAEEIRHFYDKKQSVKLKEKMHMYVKTHFSEAVICDTFTSLYTRALNN